MTPRILQFADVHLDASTRENVEHVMGQILELARSSQVDLICNCGDLAMRRGSMAPWVSAALREWHCALAEVAPVIVVAGNHDLSYADGVGTVAGALDFSAAEGRIVLAEVPRVVPMTGEISARAVFDRWSGGGAIACLPYPNRYMLQRAEPDLPASEVNARASELLERVLRGLAAEAGPGSILVFHGSRSGAKTSGETEMVTDIDIVLREDQIPEEFSCVMAGHIHRFQVFEGRTTFVYAGSPCPLNFGENHPHGVVMWEGGVPRFVELEPKHRLVTVDWATFDDWATGNHHACARAVGFTNARVRVLAKIARGADAAALADQVRAVFMNAGAVEVRFQVEREQDDRSIELEDVRSDLDHRGLLDLYAQRTPDARPVLDDLVRIFAEVDGQLPPEARALERFAEYRLNRIAFSNWKSFDEGPFEIDFETLGALTCIEGENATGKSNAVEVESFALWGKLPRGKVALGDLVRNGAQECWVEAEFVAASGTWRVRRTVRLNSRGVGVGDLALSVGVISVSGPWKPANAGTATETQKLIEQMVGPYELYLSTRLASQGDIDRLLDMTAGERKDALQEALGTKAFEHRETIAKRMMAGMERLAADYGREVENTRAMVNQVDALEAGLLAAQGDVIDTGCERRSHEESAKRARATLDAAKAAAAEAIVVNRRRADKFVEKDAADSRITSLGKELDSLRAAVDALPAVRADLENLEANRGALAAFEEEASAHRDLKAAHVEASGALAMAINELEGAKRQYEDLTKSQKGQRDDLQRSQAALRATLDERLERARKGSALIDQAPFKERCVEALCPLLAVSVADRERVPTLAGDSLDLIAKHASELEDLTEQHAQAQGESSSRIRELEAVVVEAHGAHEATQTKLTDSVFDETALPRLRRAIAAIPEKELRLREAAAQSAEGRSGAIREEIESLKSQARALLAEIASLPEHAVVDLLGPMGKLEQAEAELGRAQRAEAEAGKVLASLEGQIALLAPAREKLAAAEKEHEAAAREASVLGIFARAMGRDGIPMLILERAIPALESYANAFLGDGDLSLEIEPMRDLRNGETRSEVNIRYRDRFGDHGLAAASGFQRVALGISIRAALAKVQAEAHGLKVGHWVVDEGGFGAADANHVLELQQTLRKIAGEFNRVVFVSHLDAIRAIADRRIRVYANGTAGSVLEMVA